MNPAERFIRFAAECEWMAKFTPSPENKIEWARMAKKWLRYADFYDRQTSAAHRGSLTKRHRSRAQN